MAGRSTDTGNGLTVIVLAAGGSKRMGRRKQSLRWRDKPLLQHVIDAATRSCAAQVIVVLGASAGEVRASLQIPSTVDIVINQNFHRGLATSLQAGLELAAGQAAIAVLGDEPQITEGLIDAVAEQWLREPSAIIRCLYEGRAGHPILLAREVWDQLPRAGDEGARAVIERRPDLVQDLVVDLPAPIDVDTPRDFVRLRSDDTR